jgi:hypothetical protein
MIEILYYGLVFLGTILFCIGLVKLLNRPFHKLAISSARQLNIILDQSLSEENKDSYILKNLVKLLKWLFLNIGILVILIIVNTLPAILFLYFNSDFDIDTSSFQFYLSMFLGSFVLLLFKKKGDYSYWSKLLHTLILDNYSLGLFLLKKEIKKHAPNLSAEEKKFVIVTGLARAGTTALTNLIFDEEKFHSIRYSNVPFLLAPNFWNKIYHTKRVKKRERAHGDKVLFSENSIEALEEYFFKAHLNDSYIDDNCLRKHQISQDLLDKYYKYQDLFKSSTKETVYLAKNNNFILRYESIAEKNSQLKVFLVFRSPVNHARSLLNQHQKFITKQKEDHFVLKYMNWLGHYEFGLNQKHFTLQEENLLEATHEKHELSYWLGIWISYYSYIVKIHNSHSNLFLVDYEDLLKRPNDLKKVLGKKIEIELEEIPIDQFKPNEILSENLIDVNKDYIVRSNEIYETLLSDKVKLY